MYIYVSLERRKEERRGEGRGETPLSGLDSRFQFYSNTAHDKMYSELPFLPPNYL
jgi:hypothetical protein